MNIFFVVSEHQDWPFEIPGVTVIPAATYLIDPACVEGGSTKVFNLCSTYRYQNDGYYVSLLAEARGHQPTPDIETIRDLQSGDLVRLLGEQLGELIDCSLSQEVDDFIDLHICFGCDLHDRHAHLCEQIFKLLRVPFLHARFERARRHWHLCGIYPGSLRGIPPDRHACVAEAAIGFLKQRKIRADKPFRETPSIAILHAPHDGESASNPEAIDKFRDAAHALGMATEILAPEDANRLDEFDALFIRDTTNVNHYTWQLSRRAKVAGMVVIDDPDSILRCTNKIYLAEVLARHRIPTPKTMTVHKDNADRIVATLGLPCILKRPDGAFSLGVVKIESEQELSAKAEELLQESELILAQEYLPTEFDWRIAVLDRRPLFVCKYYMAPGHWQIIKHEQQNTCEGRIEALSIGEAPDEVVSIAVQAANLIGDGFYGVDLKQTGNQCHVIEINDNPSVDAGNEDGVLGDALYREVMGVFRKRIDARNARKGKPAP